MPEYETSRRSKGLHTPPELVQAVTGNPSALTTSSLLTQCMNRVSIHPRRGIPYDRAFLRSRTKPVSERDMPTNRNLGGLRGQLGKMVSVRRQVRESIPSTRMGGGVFSLSFPRPGETPDADGLDGN